MKERLKEILAELEELEGELANMGSNTKNKELEDILRDAEIGLADPIHYIEKAIKA